MGGGAAIGAKDRELWKWFLTGKDHSRFTKYYPEMPTGYQALKESHTKGSLMENTSRNTFPQCGKCWILLRKTKIFSLIDHFVLGKLFLVVNLGDKVGYFGHSLLKLLYSSMPYLLYPQFFFMNK